VRLGQLPAGCSGSGRCSGSGPRAGPCPRAGSRRRSGSGCLIEQGWCGRKARCPARS
jgi:hypothetical protein